MKYADRLIAHRGSMRRYPENTLIALQSAVEAGARHVEFDLQMSSDRVPVLMHDETLDRTTGVQGRVMDRPAAELAGISAHYPEQHGERFVAQKIPTLAEAIALLNRNPDVNAFIEAKRQSLAHFGVEAFVDRIMDEISPARFDWVFISFIQEAVEYARARHGKTIGWILREYSPASRQIAQTLRPEYLFCNIKRLPTPVDGLWPGPWRWVIYDIDNAPQALGLFAAGASYIETCCIRELLDELKQGA